LPIGEEEQREQKGPLSRAEWASLLKRTGFSGLEADTGGPSNASDDNAYSMILSTRCHDSAPNLPSINIISDEAQQETLVNDLSTSLRSLTQRDVTVSSLIEAENSEGVQLVLSEFDRPFSAEPTPQQFQALKRMFSNSDGVIWVVRHSTSDLNGSAKSFMTGAARSLKVENPSLRIVILELEDDDSLLSNEAIVNHVRQVLEASFNERPPASKDTEYVVRDGCIHISRVLRDDQMNKWIASETGYSQEEMQPFHQEGRSLQLEIKTPGLLNTFHFIDDDRMKGALCDDSVEVEVKAVGVNFRDLMVSTGQIDSSLLGVESSGVVTAVGKGVAHIYKGDRVITWSSGTYCNRLRCPASRVYKIPDNLSFEVAASIPIAYCTAYYSLMDVARLRAGESVLIHSASGAFGQAAVMIAQHVGARVFATVGTEEKRRFLTNTYKIPASDIFSSRDTLFARGIMDATSNKGVDVILNSLAGEGLRMSWNCIAQFGRFIEVGKRDIHLNTRLEMAQFSGNIMFASVDFHLMKEERVDMAQRLLSEVLELFAQNKIHPLQPINVYSMSNIEGAFRTMQNGKHIGKLVIKPNADDTVKVSLYSRIDHGIHSPILFVGAPSKIKRQ
jgi:NADPH:quinone reductase-like Zn-dependent oxidoreductase